MKGVKEEVVTPCKGDSSFCYAKLPELSKKGVLKYYFRSGNLVSYTMRMSPHFAIKYNAYKDYTINILYYVK